MPQNATSTAGPSWFSRVPIRLYVVVIFAMLQLLLLHSGVSVTSWFCTAVAALWLLHRASAVLAKPTDELIKILGIEVPSSPAVSLSEVRHDGCVLHWKPPEQKASVDRYDISVNGVTVGTISNQETAAVISGLLQNHFYAIRVIAYNSAKFHAVSPVVRIKTPGGALDPVPTRELPAASTLSNREPSVQPYRPQAEAIGQPAPQASVSRDHSTGHPQARKGLGHRRNTGNGPSDHTSTSASASPPRKGTSVETVQQLTERLDQLRNAITDAERQEAEEEREFQECSSALFAKRETLRQQLKDREDESKELRRAVLVLERQNTAVQSKKAAHERLLQQKMQERQKLRDDVQRWDRETLEFQEETKRNRLETDEYVRNAQKQVEEIRLQQNETLLATKAIEEEIRITGIRLKNVEEGKSDLDNDILARHLREAEEDRKMQESLNSLQATYNSLHQELKFVEFSHASSLHYVESLRAQVNALPSTFTSDSMVRESIPSRQVLANRSFTIPPSSTFVPSEARTATSTFAPREGFGASSYPFHDPSPITRSGDVVQAGIPRSEAQQLTSGAAASPSAGALLPADLLMDDSEDPSEYTSGEPPATLEGTKDVRTSSKRDSMVQVGAPEVLPGLGTLPGLGSTDGWVPSGHVPASPGSFTSRSPSLVSSPHGSVTNIHFHQPRQHSIGLMDSDRRSIRSTSSASRNPRPSRFVDFLNFRQRGKTVSSQGPALGSLKPSQSQSMPRDAEYSHGTLDPLEGSRRRGGYSSGFLGQLSNALSRKPPNSSKDQDVTSLAGDGNSLGLLGGLSGENIWSSSVAGIGRSRSPTSLYSTENLIRPTSDGPNRGWPADMAAPRSRPLTNLSTASPWSANPSRRQSIVQQDFPDTSLDSSSEMDPDAPELDTKEQGQLQAPIGTRPRESRAGLSNKQLNPVARSFEIKNMFKKRERPSMLADEGTVSADESSPAESRKSRDDRPQSATESYEESTDTYSDGGPVTPSETTAQTPNRESFIRRLTRKGSSSKVNLPFLKEKPGRRVVDADGTPDEMDEDFAGGPTSKASESVTNSPQVTPSNRSSVLSWPSFRKRPKRANDAPSIDDSSLASETGDEDEIES